MPARQPSSVFGGPPGFRIVCSRRTRVGTRSPLALDTVRAQRRAEATNAAGAVTRVEDVLTAARPGQLLPHNHAPERLRGDSSPPTGGTTPLNTWAALTYRISAGPDGCSRCHQPHEHGTAGGSSCLHLLPLKVASKSGSWPRSSSRAVLGGLDVAGAAYRLPGTVAKSAAGTLIVGVIVSEARG